MTSMRFYVQVSFIVLASSARAQWQQTNGPVGGVVNCFLWNGTTLFAGTDAAIYRSSDSGKTWTLSSNRRQGPSGILSLTQNGSTLLAGTNQTGIYRSTDNGVSWTHASSGLQTAASIYSFGMIGTMIFAGGFGDFYRSTDDGLTWTQMQNYPAATAFSIAVIGTNLFVAAGMTKHDFPNVYRSTDSGTHWTTAGAGLPGFDNFIYSLAVEDSTLIAGVNGSDVYMSTDLGSNWTSTGLNDPVFAVAVVGKDIFAGALNKMHRSTDNGASWTLANSGLPQSSAFLSINYHVQAIAVIGSTIIAGTSGAGIYRSSDNGSSWTPSETNFSNTNILCFASNGAYLFAGTAESGLFYSTNDGTSWTASNSDLPFTTVESIAANGSTLYVGTSFPSVVDYQINHGVFRSTDNGSSWTETSNGLAGTAFLSLAFDGSGNVLVGSRGPGSSPTPSPGLFQSVDNGSKWEQVYQSPNTSTGAQIILVDNYDVFAGITGNGIWSKQRGNANNGLPANPTVTAFAEIGTCMFASIQSNGIYRSTDHGYSWTQANIAWMPSISVSGLVANGTNLFASTYSGIYCSTDSGKTWTAKNAGIPDPPFLNSTVLFVKDGYLFAGTSSTGVWRRPLSEMFGQDAVARPEAIAQSLHCYPNPLTQSTTISFTPATSGYAEISIVNQLGVEVARIFSGELDAGEHRFTWEPQAAACATPGMYECVVRMYGRTEELPIIVLQ